MRPGSSSEGTPVVTGASCCNLPPGTRERSNNDESRRVGDDRPVLVTAGAGWRDRRAKRAPPRGSCFAAAAARARPMALRQQHRRGHPSADLGAAAQRSRAARPATLDSARLVARRRRPSAAAARAAEHGAAGPQRPAAPQPCTSRARPRLRSTRARAASVQEGAGSSRGRRPWLGGGAPAAGPAEHRGRRHARAAQSLPAGFFFFSLAPWRLLFALETLTSSPAARQRRSGRRPPAQQLGVGACARATNAGHSCRLPPVTGPTRRRGAGNQVARHGRHPSPVVGPSCAPALRESRETQGDPTTSKRRWRRARPTALPRSTTPTVDDWWPARRPSSPARAHSHAPAVRAAGRLPWAYRARGRTRP